MSSCPNCHEYVKPFDYYGNGSFKFDCENCHKGGEYNFTKGEAFRRNLLGYIILPFFVILTLPAILIVWVIDKWRRWW